MEKLVTDSPEGDASDSPDETGENLKFLLVDDEDFVLTQMMRILGHAFRNCRILSATNGVDALRLARDSLPDIVVLDVSMPEMDGFEICRRLKADEPTSRLPILMISGVRKDPRSKDMALALGADDYLLKPFETEDLVFHIKVLLRAKRAEDALSRQKRQIEEELRSRTLQLYERERMYRELVEALPDAVFETDSDLKVKYMNPAGMAMFGYTPGEVASGLSLTQMIVMTTRQAGARIRRILAGSSPDASEYMVVGKNGEKFITRINLAPVIHNDEVLGLRGIIIDISAFKRLQHELIESREGYYALFRNMFDAFCLCEALFDADGRLADLRFLEVNPAFERMLDKSGEDLVGRLFLSVMPASESYWIEAFSHVALTGNTVRVEKYFSEMGRSVQMSAFRAKPGVLAILFQDISDRKIAEEQEKELYERKIQAGYLESIASLTGNVAHELSNILGPVMCYPDLVLECLPADSPAREDLAIIKESTKRAIEVVDDLAIFGRSGIVERQQIDLNAAISEYMESGDVAEIRKKHPDLNFAVDLAPESPEIVFNKTHLNRILETMIYRDYAGEGKSAAVSIASRCVDVASPFKVYMRQIVPGAYAALEIHDSGLAMDMRQAHELFELPKKYVKRRIPQGKIALSLAYAALENYGGFLDINPHPKGGIIFAFYFLRVAEGEAEATGEPQAIGGGETILVVDDMPAQRDMVEKLLSAFGYAVLTASDGESAVAIMEKYASAGGSCRHPDLVILDMVMPGMDGLETFKRIKAINPAQKCLIASGYAKNDKVREAEALGVNGFIRKPYSRDAFARTVYFVLHGKSVR